LALDPKNYEAEIVLAELEVLDLAETKQKPN
jgi:hypothetical protein